MRGTTVGKRWAHSWALARASFAAIGRGRETLWFPALAGLFSVLFSAALLVPTVALRLAGRAGAPRSVVGPLDVAALVTTYVGLAFIATFFNVCVVYTTRVRLSGGDARFGESIEFALSRAHLIAAWAAASATVGLLLRALDAVARRTGFVGGLVLALSRALFGGAWALSTAFVTPAMVYKGLGPVDAVRDSVATLRRVWGDELARHYGLGLAAFAFALPCAALVVVAIAAAQAAPALAVALVALAWVGLLATIALFGLAGAVFKTALYHWATIGGTPAGFDPALLAGAFTRR